MLSLIYYLDIVGEYVFSYGRKSAWGGEIDI